MKTIISHKSPLSIVFFILLSSCSPDFLDKTPYQVSSAQIQIENLVLGLYYETFAQGAEINTYFEDFGQKGVDISTDLMSGDMGFSATPNPPFRGIYQFAYQTRTGRNSQIIWNYYYKLIRNANEILDIIGNDTEIPDDESLKIPFGQAKTIRAFAYFYLANLFQHPYGDNPDALCVPVYTTALREEYKAQSTVKEVYAQIIRDLEDAATALEGYDRGTGKYQIDQNVALAYLAYAYMQRGETGDYQKAADAAGTVIDSGKFPLMTADEMIKSGFNSVTLKSWIWAMDITAENAPAQGVYSFWSNIDYFTYGYVSRGNIKIIDADLYASIPETDIRKQQFGAPVTGEIGAAPLTPVYKFYDSKRISGGDALYTNDLLYIRAEEMVLIKAEALARLGNLSESLNSLNSLISLRNPAATLENLSQEDLLEQIWFNWRVECWGEGKTYFAMKRYKKTMHRSDAEGNHNYMAGKDFPYNYERMIFEIPEYEWVNNPNLIP
ncbi:MAG: RagB/SusD family nutrient uptake outer membrane protein [Dysgonamonadaceae bacterium]|jgi:hypothetical protein|nr:RagB/SusD family nutrient uptake outer membrane protein [Dysgonamonadaceae bacterium]